MQEHLIGSAELGSSRDRVVIAFGKQFIVLLKRLAIVMWNELQFLKWLKRSMLSLAAIYRVGLQSAIMINAIECNWRRFW